MTKREQYPVAPADVQRRREWFDRRDKLIQGRGVRPADGVTFAKAKKQVRDGKAEGQ